VTPVVTDTLGSTSDLVGDVTPVVTDTLGSTSDLVGDVTPVVTDTLNSTSDVVGGVTPALADGVNTIATPFTTSVDTGSLGDDLAAITAPFTTTVDAGVGSVGDGITTAAGPVGDGVDAIITPWTVDVATAGAPAGDDAVPLASSVFEESPAVWAMTGNGTGVHAVDAAASSVDGSSLTDVMSQVAPDARLLASAAVLTFASEAILGARFVGPGADARMAFTNVRLLPCLVRSGVEQQLAALTGGRAPAASVVGARGGGSSPGDSGGSAGSDEEKRGAIRGTIESFVRPLREGFDQATREAAGEVTDGFSDSRLMVQIGMALGVVYLAFLSVWFWATRVRWSSRA
jgi:hypothetical protein